MEQPGLGAGAGAAFPADLPEPRRSKEGPNSFPQKYRLT